MHKKQHLFNIQSLTHSNSLSVEVDGKTRGRGTTVTIGQDDAKKSLKPLTK